MSIRENFLKGVNAKRLPINLKKTNAISLNGYFPLFKTPQEAINVSPELDFHIHEIEGKTYYMPNGLGGPGSGFQFHGDYDASNSNLSFSNNSFYADDTTVVQFSHSGVKLVNPFDLNPQTNKKLFTQALLPSSQGGGTVNFPTSYGIFSGDVAKYGNRFWIKTNNEGTSIDVEIREYEISNNSATGSEIIFVRSIGVDDTIFKGTPVVSQPSPSGYGMCAIGPAANSQDPANPTIVLLMGGLRFKNSFLANWQPGPGSYGPVSNFDENMFFIAKVGIPPLNTPNPMADIRPVHRVSVMLGDLVHIPFGGTVTVGEYAGSFNTSSGNLNPSQQSLVHYDPYGNVLGQLQIPANILYSSGTMNYSQTQLFSYQNDVYFRGNIGAQSTSPANNGAMWQNAPVYKWNLTNYTISLTDLFLPFGADAASDPNVDPTFITPPGGGGPGGGGDVDDPVGDTPTTISEDLTFEIASPITRDIEEEILQPTYTPPPSSSGSSGGGGY